MCIQRMINKCQLDMHIVSRFYTGKVVIVSVIDLELVKNVTVKDSANFINREVSG